MPLTAHFIGGCAIGDSPETGVVDPYQRVYGHPGLHVVDGSAISANLGVNPSLTITAQAERAMAFWPNKGEADPRPALGTTYAADRRRSRRRTRSSRRRRPGALRLPIVGVSPEPRPRNGRRNPSTASSLSGVEPAARRTAPSHRPGPGPGARPADDVDDQGPATRSLDPAGRARAARPELRSGRAGTLG